MSSHKECRYCDGGFYPIVTDDGERVCSHCGAEWNPVFVEDGDDE